MDARHLQSSELDHQLPPVRLAPIAGSSRRVAIAVDLSDESAHAVKWAVQHYLRPGDAVVLLHVQPTSVLYGADWGAVETDKGSEESRRKLEDDFDSFTSSKADELARPLLEAGIPFTIHIVKDHDMKERLCLEVERLGLSAMIMGSRGFGAARRTAKGKRLGSVSDYCVHHCVCPVVVVRYQNEQSSSNSIEGGVPAVSEEAAELHPVMEVEEEELEAAEEQKEVHQYNTASDR